uniref:CAP-Gly domain-containing linker protein 1 n=1 Tax=Lygus hesperus TaxID=30085 RepID=A0A0A9ZI60_LYGHE
MAQMIDTSSDSSSQLTRINAELNEKLKELDELKLSNMEAAREHKNREQELSQQLDSIKLTSEELRKELDIQKEHNEAQNNLIQNKLKVHISELESKLEDSVKTHVTTKQEKDALNEKVLQLEKSLKEVSCKFEESVKCKEDAMKNLEETKKLVEEGEIDKSNKSKEIDSLVSKLSNLEHDFKIISEEKLQLNEKLKHLEVARSESSSEMAKLKEENSSLLVKLDALSNATGNEMSVLKKCVDEKDEVIKNQLSNIEELKAKLGAADELVKKANKEIEGKNEELSVFKTSLKDTEGVRQNIIKEKEAMSAENEKLQIQASELTDRLMSSEQKELQLKKEIDVMGQRLQNLESSLEASSKSVEALKASQREKESQLSDIQESSTAKEAEFSARIEAMNKQLSELNIVLEMSQEEHENEVDKLKQKENVLANDLKKKEEDLIEASEKLAKYENELKMVKANSSEASKTLSDEVETLRKSSETTISSLSDKLKEQEREIKVKCDNEIKLEEQVKSMAGELEMMKKQNDNLVNAKLNNESEVAELSNQRRKAAEEKLKLEKELEESQAQALRFKQQLETEVSNRAATSTDLAKLESQLNLVKQEKLSVDEKLKSTMDELSRAKSKSETPRKAAQPDENGATKSEEDAALNNWLEEKELADSQINFLNAIIVDMKKKNDDLQAQLDAFGRNGMQLSPSKIAKEVAPRLFCDICDMFDLHDTEDCPQQASDSPPPSPRPHRIAGSRKMEERPYCDICEVFGHDSSECDDAETF